MPPGEFGKTIEYCLKRLVEFFGVDRGTLMYWPEGEAGSRETYSWNKEEIKPYNVPPTLEEFSYLAKTVMNREIFSFSSIDELPYKAQAEKDNFLSEGIKSAIVIPMIVEGRLLGSLGFDSYRTENIWTSDIVQ